jgi:CxxC motif-containing protein (DUF1111 family)
VKAAFAIVCLGSLFAICTALAVSDVPEPGEEWPGGAATDHGPRDRSAFLRPAASLEFDRQLEFKVGDGVFRKLWVAAPSSTKSSDGLGPLFNARSCQGCHLKDGRGSPPAKGELPSSLLFVLARPDGSPDPVYGGQLQTFAIAGHAAEGDVKIEFRDKPVRLADGTIIKLQKPIYTVTNPGYGPLDPSTALSPRVAPPMIGVGLLELVPEAEILSRADPEDDNHDGIRGQTRRVFSRAENRETIGRFGWKLGSATIADQTANAFFNDMGLSTPLRTDGAGDCMPAQKACKDAPNGADAREGVEVTRQMFDLTVFYSRHLAVPVRIDVAKPKVLRGKRLFSDLGCAACHTPTMTTGNDPARPALSNQSIWPYTDLLLHDMGDDLADGTPDGRLWRTPPLWGLGLTRTVSGHTRLLHDGRARNVLEAVLWHEGEGLAARDRFAKLNRADRAALLTFLDSL